MMVVLELKAGGEVGKKPENSVNDAAWRAVLERDRRYDGMFVYAVKSTGVYCRPSCPSRRPRREMVEFFERTQDAEAAGFRSCLRCRPNNLNGQREMPQVITRVCRFIDEIVEEGPTLDRLAEVAGVSPFHLQRSFKSTLGISPRQYAELKRFLKFKSRLQEGDDVTTAMYEAGFNSPSRLYERSTSSLGMKPSVYKAGAPGQRIRYALADSSLGRVLVASTDKGVCAVRIGDSDKALEAILRDEFSRAELMRDDDELAAVVRDIVNAAEGNGLRREIPLDIQHTAFQWKVWQALRKIALGETRSYQEIAKAIGEPKAVRAVANACASNPVALVIPCHRVVRTNGDLGGYRWGAERKKKLLEKEKQWK
ncbi:MAG TPA: bifunctional DNA-binding transcriptional regulator/O6-methylguanine-DNA methyltransferase Ada [Terriglobales bacterium]|nr:bifunctional DNA-binding transcriptional regulator/O6-methylguanine-DNA methyltransferase Ada [Terriglobales bacterium]